MIYTIILAAGAGSRIGNKPKALLIAPQGRNFVTTIAHTVREAGGGGVSAVIGPPHGDAVKKGLPPGVGAMTNPRPDRGMLSSVQTGIMALPSNAVAVLVWPVDVPTVQVATVRAILSASPGRIIVPTYNKKGGHPVRIPRERFGEIMALDGEATLKDLIASKPELVERLAVDDKGILVDVDTQADFDALAATAKK